jgi:hypothetical protein
MARITIVTDNCRSKISPACTGTMTYERKPGRPPVACKHCRDLKKVKATATNSVNVRPTEGTCGCGNKYVIQPKGRISNRCTDCRENGTVWRADEDGQVQRISSDEHSREVSREEQERRDEAGRKRASDLFDRMQPLLAKKHRTVIVH